MEEGKSPLTPSKVWSPHSAALHRRRKVGEKGKNAVLGSLGGLDLDDDDDMFEKMMKSPSKSPSGKSPGKSPGRNKKRLSAKDLAASKEQDVDDELRKSLEGLSDELKGKLAKVLNKNTPMKERLELEVQMMKDPKERKTLADFKYKYDRKNFNLKIFETELDKQEQLEKNLDEEAKRAKEEQAEFAKRRQERIEEEIAKKEREAQLLREIQVHKAKNNAQLAEELRKEAEKTNEGAIRNKERKEREAREREERIQNFINGEGQLMTDVERELKLARMLNDGSI